MANCSTAVACHEVARQATASNGKHALPMHLLISDTRPTLDADDILMITVHINLIEVMTNYSDRVVSRYGSLIGSAQLLRSSAVEN
jgi:hypothetical protein